MEARSSEETERSLPPVTVQEGLGIGIDAFGDQQCVGLHKTWVL